ncbi:MAG: hypothetical protein WC231_00180 [Dehalococcoidales bacterium]
MDREYYSHKNNYDYDDQTANIIGKNAMIVTGMAVDDKLNDQALLMPVRRSWGWRFVKVDAGVKTRWFENVQEGKSLLFC